MNKKYFYNGVIVTIVSIKKENFVEVCEIFNYGHKFICNMNDLIECC